MDQEFSFRPQRNIPAVVGLFAFVAILGAITFHSWFVDFRAFFWRALQFLELVILLLYVSKPTLRRLRFDNEIIVERWFLPVRKFPYREVRELSEFGVRFETHSVRFPLALRNTKEWFVLKRTLIAGSLLREKQLKTVQKTPPLTKGALIYTLILSIALMYFVHVVELYPAGLFYHERFRGGKFGEMVVLWMSIYPISFSLVYLWKKLETRKPGTP